MHFPPIPGKELWSAELPASAHVTPITYAAGGKQFVVIAAGGEEQFAEEGPSDRRQAIKMRSPVQKTATHMVARW